MPEKVNSVWQYLMWRKQQLLTFLQIKKWLKFSYSFLLIICCSILLIACADNNVVSQSSQLQGNLFIWHSLEPDMAELVDQGFREFEHLNPDVKIQSVYVPKDQIIANFIEQSQKGFGASAIIELTQNLPILIENKRLQAIAASEIDENRYYSAPIDQVRYQDKLYGIPLASHTRVLCYNQAKLKAKEDKSLNTYPKTLEELMERAKKGYSVGIISNFEETFWGIGNFRGEVVNSQGEKTINLGVWSQWLTWLKQAVAQRNFVILRAEDKILDQAFLKGSLAYYICNSADILTFKKALKDNFKVALLPGNENFKASPFLYTQALMINRSASENERILAIALGKFLSNPEHQLKDIVQSESFIPTNRQVVMDKAFLPIESVLLEQAKTAVAIRLDNLTKILPSFEVAESLYQSAIAGEISTEKAAHELTQVTDRQLGR